MTPTPRRNPVAQAQQRFLADFADSADTQAGAGLGAMGQSPG